MSLIRNANYLGGNQELVTFLELYWVNIKVNDRITLNHPRYVIEHGINQPIFYYLFKGSL